MKRAAAWCPAITRKGGPDRCPATGRASHFITVARAEGVSFTKVWRLADRECIELMAGWEAKGYCWLSPARRAAVIEALYPSASSASTKCFTILQRLNRRIAESTSCRVWKTQREWS
jgi:hypothetical protein